ncbi:MAG: hypothetical protein IPP72_09525 [Chitinophagaceae bacterium]|nr:hypothetical protein [Chitinophagaceae bacterium]
MKRKLTNAALALTGCLFILSCRNKEAVTPVSREISVPGFDKVPAGDDHEVIITAGNTFSMQARGDIADVNELRAAIESRNLKIDYPVYRSNRKRVHINNRF